MFTLSTAANARTCDQSAAPGLAPMPLSRCTRLSTSDLYRVHAHMSDVLMPHSISTVGHSPIAFTHNQAALKNVSFNSIDYGMPRGRVVISAPEVSHFLFQFSLSGSCEVRRGREAITVPPGHMLVIGPGRDLTVSLPADYRHFTARVPVAAMESALARQLGYRPGSTIRFNREPLPEDGRIAPLVGLIETICADLNRTAPTYTHARVGETLEASLIDVLLMTVPHSYSDDLAAPVQRPAAYYVRRVEEYIHQKAPETVTLDDLIAVSGVSARALHAGFRRFRDTTPMKYLKAYRLDLARRTLLNGADRGSSITDVAMASGFAHLSKFARDYALRFGETPSATRQRCAPSSRSSSSSKQ
jgi:AraC-like DNA-binding protein